MTLLPPFLSLFFAIVMLPSQTLAQNLAEAKVVRVGGYPFLPFVDPSSNGVTKDLIKALNGFQTRYQFQFVPTSANRRYTDLANSKFDLIFFENIQWGWDAKSVATTKVFLKGDGEVYVALAKPGRDQHFFDKVQDKHLLAVLGYHYAFANFEGDRNKLAAKYKISFCGDNEVSIKQLLSEKGDIAILTKSYLDSYILKNPTVKSRLLVSTKFDQHYEHTAIVKKGNTPSAEDIQLLLEKMEQAGELNKVWRQYGFVP